MRQVCSLASRRGTRDSQQGHLDVNKQLRMCIYTCTYAHVHMSYTCVCTHVHAHMWMPTSSFTVNQKQPTKRARHRPPSQQLIHPFIHVDIYQQSGVGVRYRFESTINCDSARTPPSAAVPVNCVQVSTARAPVGGKLDQSVGQTTGTGGKFVHPSVERAPAKMCPR